jgi:hypothetical protein
MLNDRVLADRNMAGPFAGGTGLDGFGLHDQRLVCQNLHLEMAAGPRRGDQSGDDLNWGAAHWTGLWIRAPAPLLQSAIWTVWMA